MRNLIDGGERPDEEVAFYDCILYIMAFNYESKKRECVVQYLNAPYDEPISLAQIQEAWQGQYDQLIVIADSALHGSVYAWNEYEGWRKYGKTMGYA